MPPLSRLGVSLLTPWGVTSPWFLYSLFMCCLLVAPFRRSPKTLLWSAVVVALLPHVGILPWTASTGTATSLRSIAFEAGGLLGWKDVLWLYPFLAAGFLAAAYAPKLETYKKPIVVAGAVAAPVLLVTVWPLMLGSSAMAPWLHTLAGPQASMLADYVLVLARYLLAFSWIAVLFYVVPALGSTVEKGLAFLGVNSLGIYCVHILLLGHSGHGIGTGPVLWITGFTFVLFGSLFVTLVIARIPYARNVLLGQRSGTDRRSAPSALP
jgi:hypothetical protein